MFSDTMLEEVVAEPACDERGEKNVGVEDDSQRVARTTGLPPLASLPAWDTFQMGIPTRREGVMGTVKQYEAKLDARNRLTIRDAGYEHYHVQELDDGTVVLKPRVLVSPTLLTAETLEKAEAGRDLEEFETAEELFQDLES